MTRIPVRHLPVRLEKNVRRVVMRPFDTDRPQYVKEVFETVMQLSDAEVQEGCELVTERFGRRHKRFEQSLLESFHAIKRHLGSAGDVSTERKILMGAYFSMEYSIEAAALFNPSIVQHPDQSGLPAGALRFILSLRAVGEGHISSTEFQTGTILPTGAIALDPTGAHTARACVWPDRQYVKDLFQRKLVEIAAPQPATDLMMSLLPDRFTLRQLEEASLRTRRENPDLPFLEAAIGAILTLANANYTLRLDTDETISDLVLFPRSETEASGIEDMRLVRFVDDDGSATYFGTYTAFDRRHIFPMLLETRDFREVSIHTLNGACVQNKGLALFPRRIDGHYAMCSRIDGRNLYLMFSDNIHFWETASILAKPRYPWEFRLIGNCGSPVETEAGWLLITHGTGPMRQYSIGAMLLDRDDPFRVLGRLRTPLITPSEEEREGYVPNVVYSCGCLIHNQTVILPYAVSDTATRIASVKLEDLLTQLLHDKA